MRESLARTTSSFRPHVTRAWQRSAALGCRYGGGLIPRPGPEPVAALAARESGLIAAAKPFLRALSEATGKRQHAILLADRDGYLVAVVGPHGGQDLPDTPTIRAAIRPQAGHGAGRKAEHAATPLAIDIVPGLVGLVPGARLAEAAMGANGIGSALAESGYVDFTGSEHTSTALHRLTTQGVPVRGPGGVIAGVVGVVTRSAIAARQMRELLLCASLGIEDALAAHALPQHARAADSWAAGTSLERLRQDLIQLHAAACLRLDIAAQRMAEGGDVAALIDTSRSLSARFRRRAALWRELAGVAPAEACAVDVSDRLAGLCELLATETQIREISITHDHGSAVTVPGDAQAISRMLLGGLLASMERAGKGGAVDIAIVPPEPGARGLVRICMRAHAADASAGTTTYIELPVHGH